MIVRKSDDFDKRFDSISKTADKIQRIAIFVIIGGWLVGLGTLGFAIWVAVKVLAHYGIL